MTTLTLNKDPKKGAGIKKPPALERYLNPGRAGLLMIAAATAAGLLLLAVTTGGAKAADLSSVGGNCCADLEERIAELEATTATKGNRKVSLTVYGQVSEAITWYDIPLKSGDFTHTQVQSNSNRDAQTYFGLAGQAQITPDVHMGFALEVGAGGFNNVAALPWLGGNDTNAIYTRQEFVFIKSDQFGKLSIGKQMLATYDTNSTGLGNTQVAHTALSLAPLVGPTVGSALDVFDGGITESIKYTSPRFFAQKGPHSADGIWFEGDWASATNLNAGTFLSSANGDLWDLALKGVKEFDQVKVVGKVGYRDGAVIDLSTLSGLGLGGGINLQGVKVWTVTGGAQHVPTGVFVSGTYSDLSYSSLLGSGACAGGCPDLKAWELQAGVEERWWRGGKTTIFANYGQSDLSALGWGTGNKSYGLGLVQNVESVAADFYLDWERYSLTDAGQKSLGLTGDIDVVMGGARVKF